MKKIILGCIVLFANIYCAAQMQHQFTDKTTYKSYKSGSKQSQDLSVINYSNSEKGLMEVNQLAGFSDGIFYDKDGSVFVRFRLNNELELYGYAKYQYDEDIEIAKKTNYTVKKTGTSETINGQQCNHYLLEYKYAEDDIENESFSGKTLKVCINEKSDINNSGMLSIYTEFFGRRGEVGKGIPDGLVMKFSTTEDYDKEYLLLDTKEKENLTVYFNKEEALKKWKAETEAQRLEDEEMEKNIDVTADSVDAAVDATTTIDDNTYTDATLAAGLAVADAAKGYELPKYESVYKKKAGNGCQ